ncbi:hypothetical protein B1R32_10228 [Abditibacterium utsteinense]|uniref:YcxB-like protein n=1 Tax=Abditibacterium utsteinense TaxID=1960156 RepID=A0A2S8SW42_9BACT|nr:hypothetical protein B1R32_10228 [Abditibacterium utsteinense]
MNQTLRFQFKSPTANELRWLGKLRFLQVASPLLSCLALAAIALANTYPSKTLTTLVFVALIVWGLSSQKAAKIKKQLECSEFGFVDFTPTELRISHSLHSLLLIKWSDFKGFELNKNNLQLRFYDARFTPDRAHSERLDQLRLRDLEDAETLLAELQKHSDSTKNQTSLS